MLLKYLLKIIGEIDIKLLNRFNKEWEIHGAELEIFF